MHSFKDIIEWASFNVSVQNIFYSFSSIFNYLFPTDKFTTTISRILDKTALKSSAS